MRSVALAALFSLSSALASDHVLDNIVTVTHVRTHTVPCASIPPPVCYKDENGDWSPNGSTRGSGNGHGPHTVSGSPLEPGTGWPHTSLTKSNVEASRTGLSTWADWTEGTHSPSVSPSSSTDRDGPTSVSGSIPSSWISHMTSSSSSNSSASHLSSDSSISSSGGPSWGVSSILTTVTSSGYSSLFASSSSSSTTSSVQASGNTSHSTISDNHSTVSSTSSSISSSADVYSSLSSESSSHHFNVSSSTLTTTSESSSIHIDPSPSSTLTTTSETSTTSSTSETASPSSPADFLIIIEQIGLDKLRRDTSYVGVDNTTGTVVTTATSNAAKRFWIDAEGYLRTGNSYIALNTASSSTTLETSDAKPAAATTVWTLDILNKLTMVGYSGFCVDSQGRVLALGTSGAAASCNPVSLVKDVEPAASSSSSSSMSSTTSTSSEDLSGSSTVYHDFTSTTLPATTSASVSAPVCSATGTGMLPILDTSVDRLSSDNLNPSTSTTLLYSDGTNAIAVVLELLYPAITLENSALITGLECGQDSIVLSMSDRASLDLVEGWQTENLVLITNSNGCNTATARGVYLVQSLTTVDSDLGKVAFAVKTSEWSEVAELMTIKFGVVEAAPDADSYTSTCSNTFDHSSTTASSSTSMITTSAASNISTTTSSQLSSTSSAPEGLITLSPGAKELYDLLMANMQYDSNGNIIIHPERPPTSTVSVETAPFDPNNTAIQGYLADLLANDLLPDPSTLFDTINNETESTKSSGQVCQSVYNQVASLSNPSGTRKRSSTSKHGLVTKRSPARHPMPRRPKPLSRREDATGWDYACSEVAGGFFGFIGEFGDIGDGISALYEGTCMGKDIYDNRDSLHCLIYPNDCITYETIYYPPAMNYTFDYPWEITFSSIKNAWLYQEPGDNMVYCVECGLKISEIRFTGEIIVNATANRVDSAKMDAYLTQEATLKMGVLSWRPFTGSVVKAMSTADLEEITLDSMFSIKPSVIYSLGAQWKTTGSSLTSVYGGVTVGLDKAHVSLDLNARTSNFDPNAWNPTIQTTFPTYSNDDSVLLTPLLRTDVRLNINVLNGKVDTTVALTSDTIVSFDTSYSTTATDICPANRLNLRSYMKVDNSVVYGLDKTKETLFSKTTDFDAKCLNVPSRQVAVDPGSPEQATSSTVFPAPTDVASLASVGGEFCTSFNKYTPPVSFQFTDTTLTVPETTTTTVDQTITSTTTKTIWSSPTITQTLTWYQASTSWVTVGSGTLAMETPFIKKREAPTPTAPPQLSERSIPEPHLNQVQKRDLAAASSLVSDWSNQEISFACSQIATGKSTRTWYSATSTETSGTSTITSTRTVNANGPLVTTTSTTTFYSVVGVSRSYTGVVTGTKTASCPLQTQATCFRAIGRGSGLIDGLALGEWNGQASNNAMFSPNGDGAIFYLTCNGNMVSVTDGTFFGGDSGNPYSYTPGFYTPNEVVKLSVEDGGPGGQAWYSPHNCAINPTTRQLTCQSPDGYMDQMYVRDPTFGGGASTNAIEVNKKAVDNFWFSTNYASPQWLIDYAWLAKYVPITLEAEEVECPCGYSLDIKLVQMTGQPR